MAKPAAKPATPANTAGDDEMEEKTVPWGKVSYPKTAKKGEEVQVKITLNENKVKADQILKVDLHGFTNGKRVMGLGAAKPVKVKAGETEPITMGTKVPNKDGLLKVVVVIYASPDGGFANKTIYTEIGIDVEN